MEVEPADIPGVLIIRPTVHRDARGTFLETWHRERYAASGVDVEYVQDNVSVSHRGVLRGLHGQRPPHAQGTLVSVLQGRVFDVVVDIRANSPTNGRWLGMELDAASGTQLYIPPGFLHGFQALEDHTVFSYKCTTQYMAEAEFSVRWDDPAIGVAWPDLPPRVSEKDHNSVSFADMLNEVSTDLF